MFNPEIFREYDIRGVVGKDYDEKFAFALGQSFVTYLLEHGKGDDPIVTVGQDARLSSPAIAQALSEGLMSAGANVVRLGLVTTPISYFSMFEYPGAQGGIMVTGSHNPPEYNGFKISFGKSTIFGEEIQKLRAIMDRGQFPKSQGSMSHHDIFPTYIERYKKEFAAMPKVPVVLDCGNGAAGCIVRRLYEEAAGLKPVILFEEPDGKFPNHHPDPTVEKNLKDLVKAVKENKAVAGIGFDGDADRIGVVDHTGRFVLGDELMVIVSRAILAEKPGSIIVGDVKCSDRLYEDIRQHGGRPIMWKTGHSLIKTKIKEEKAPFGGELSGHVFFSDRNYGYDDALYAGLRLVEILGKSGKTIDQLLAGLPHAYNTPEIRIDTTEEKKWSIVKRLKEIYNRDTEEYRVNMIDGVRVSFKNGWALARASNTQPVLVLRFEADSAEALSEIRGRIESVVNPLL
ncbi:MAG: phosphomannomutase/phosphoglucomutase [Bdellovibrionaceae bacterium]|nr:phosphomannomutase/phosphoglucomutase [Pseudobdellovibrionaceae bacterium]